MFRVKPFENTDLVRLTHRRVTRFAAVLSIAVSMVHAILLVVLESPLWSVSLAYSLACCGLLWLLNPKRQRRIFILGLFLFWALYLTTLSIMTLSLGRIAGFQTLLLGMFPIMVVSSRISAGAKLVLVVIFALYVVFLQEVAGTSQPTTLMDATAFSVMRGLNLGAAILAISSIVWQYFQITAEQQAELTALASTDLLTGLHNRRMMTELGGREVARSLRHKLPLSLLMCDLDNFKTVNDEHGHEVGDAVLAAFATMLRAIGRESESLCRWGGEEFLVLLPSTDLPGAQVLAERIRKAIEEHIFLPETKQLKLTLTIGAASLSPGEDFQTLLKRADGALLTGKRAGRNRVSTELGTLAA